MTYRIKDWNALYETHDTRKLKRLSWVPVPAKLNGNGYLALLAKKNGPSLFGCWISILELGVVSSNRGQFVHSDGTALTPREISIATHMPLPLVQQTLKVLCAKSFGWIERIRTKQKTRHSPGESPGNLPVHRENLPDEGKGKKGKKEKKGKEENAAPPSPSILSGYTEHQKAIAEAVCMALGRNLLAMNDDDREALLEWVTIGEGQYPETGFEELIARCAKLHPVRNAYSLAKGIAEGWALPPGAKGAGVETEVDRLLERMEEGK